MSYESTGFGPALLGPLGGAPFGAGLDNTPINVVDGPFNAKGNGLASAEDDRRIQDALLEGALKKRPVFIPPTTAYYFLRDTTLLLPSNTYLFGMGRWSKLRRIITGAVASGRVLMNQGAVGWSSGANVNQNIIIANLCLSMQGSIRPSSSRIYATASFYGVTGLQLEKVLAEFGIHFNIDCDTCDDVDIDRLRVESSDASTPVGNVDGLHLACCRDVRVRSPEIFTGDDCIGITTYVTGGGAVGRTSERIEITGLDGTSKEAHGVFVGTEGTGGFDLLDTKIRGVRFKSLAATPTGMAVRIKGDCASFPSVFNVSTRGTEITDVDGTLCGHALHLDFAEGVSFKGIRAYRTSDHGVNLNGPRDVVGSNIFTQESGHTFAQDKAGVQVVGDRIALSVIESKSDGARGIDINSCNDVTVDDAVVFGAGNNAAGATDTAGFRVINSNRVQLGGGCCARANGVQEYGVQLGAANADVFLDAPPENFQGTTANVSNTGGARLRGKQGPSGDRGDANITIVVAVDEEEQRFATNLTANRTVTLSATNIHKGAKFRVTRTGLGAFTLDVGGLKTIPAGTAAFVDVEHDGTAWRYMAFGNL